MRDGLLAVAQPLIGQQWFLFDLQSLNPFPKHRAETHAQNEQSELCLSETPVHFECPSNPMKSSAIRYAVEVAALPGIYVANIGSSGGGADSISDEGIHWK